MCFSPIKRQKKIVMWIFFPTCSQINSIYIVIKQNRREQIITGSKWVSDICLGIRKIRSFPAFGAKHFWFGLPRKCLKSNLSNEKNDILFLKKTLQVYWMIEKINRLFVSLLTILLKIIEIVCCIVLPPWKYNNLHQWLLHANFWMWLSNHRWSNKERILCVVANAFNLRRQKFDIYMLDLILKNLKQ